MKKQIRINNKKPALVFKKWTGKSYSVFNTLNRVVKITTLNLAYSIVLLPSQVLCQTDTSITKNLDLEEVIVSAQRAPIVYSQLSRQVSILDKDEIKLMPVSNLNELLENFTGLDVRQRGANGIQADLSIRGGSFDQNLILLNGVNISDPQTGHHSLNLPIDLNSIERVEILEGSGSRVFGPNAFSGAINIITNSSDKNYINASFTAGDFGLFSESLSSAYNFNKSKHFISISKSQSKGYIKNTDFDRYNVFYNTQYKNKNEKIDFQIGYTDKAFGANSFYTPAYPDQFEQTKTTFTSLKFETGKTIKLIPSIYYRRHQDRFELFRYEPATWYKGHNYHLTDVYGTKLDARMSTKFGVTSFGAELRSENIWSNVLGEPMNDTIKAIGETEAYYTRKYSRTVSNYFLEHSVVLGKFAVSAGLLTSWVSENDFDYNFYPGIDLSYRFLKHFNTYLSINKSLRLPTFTDLFYNGPNNIGNPDLKPEESWSYEFGLKFENKYIKSNVIYFNRDAYDVIEWVRLLNIGTDIKWETQNLTNVETNGISINNKINIDRYGIKNLSVNYSFLDQSTSSDIDTLETKYSLNYLKHNLNIGLKHKIINNLNLTWSLRYQDRAGSYLKYDINTKEYSEQNYNSFWLIDLKLNWEYKFLNLYAEISNLLNENYIDIGNIEMPGRWFKLGFNVHIAY